MKSERARFSRIALILSSAAVLSIGNNCGDDRKPTPPDEPITQYLTLPSIAGLRVEITLPADQSKVQRVNTFKGTVSGLPSGYVLRVFVYPQLVGLWYPQHPVIMLPDSSWSAMGHVGDEHSGGQEFLIGAMAVTEEQRQIIDEDISGRTRFVISGHIPAIITVTRL